MFRKIIRPRTVAAMVALAAVAALSFPAVAHEGREVGDLNFVVGFLNEPAIEGQPNAASVRITHHDDTAAADDGAMEMGHGGLFTSLAVAAGESFEYTFDSALEGQTIGYHVHPVEQEGTVSVSSGSGLSGMTTIEVMSTGVDPGDLAIEPGTTVMFHNMTGAEMVVMSGSAASMSGDSGTAAELEASLQVEIRHLASGESMTADLEERFNDAGHYVAHFIPTSAGTYEFHVFGTVSGTEIDETFTGGPTTFSDVTAASEIQFPIQLAAAREVENAARGAQQKADQAVKDADGASSTATLAMMFGIIGIGVGAIGTGLGAWGIRAAKKR